MGRASKSDLKLSWKEGGEEIKMLKFMKEVLSIYAEFSAWLNAVELLAYLAGESPCCPRAGGRVQRSPIGPDQWTRWPRNGSACGLTRNDAA
jgi:hypothetical protein